MLNTLRLKSSNLFGTHALLDKSLRVLQPQLDSSEILDCIHYDVN